MTLLGAFPSAGHVRQQALLSLTDRQISPSWCNAAILHFNMSNNSEDTDRQSCIVSLIVAKEHQKIFNNF